MAKLIFKLLSFSDFFIQKHSSFSKEIYFIKGIQERLQVMLFLVILKEERFVTRFYYPRNVAFSM